MSPPRSRCLRRIGYVSTKTAIRADPFLVPAKTVLEGSGDGALLTLGAAVAQPTSAEARFSKDGTVGGGCRRNDVCADVDVDVQQFSASVRRTM